MNTVISITLAVVGVLVSVVMFYPSPPLSSRIMDWQSRGHIFAYKEHNVFYRDVKGTGSHGTLICLHGFPTFSWDYSKVLPGLQSQFSRVILLDFLGYGLSDKPVSHTYSIFEQADIVAHLAESLSVTKAHLLSHDYGDTVAQELLARYNHAVVSQGKQSQTVPSLSLQSLTMLNGGVFPETNFPRTSQKLLLIPVLGPLLGRLFFFTAFKTGFGEVLGDNKPSEDEYTDLYAALCHKDGKLVLPSLLQYIPERRANRERWVSALRNSHIPVLMIYGPADPVNPPVFVDLFRREAPQHKLVILNENIGHYPQLEDPESTLHHIMQFMQELANKSTS